MPVRKLFSKEQYKEKADKYFNFALGLIIERNYSSAYDYLNQAIELYDQKADYFYFKGLASYYLHRDDARESINKAISINPNNTDYQLWYSIICYEEKDYQEAKKTLLLLYASIGEKEERVSIYLARVFNELNEPDKAIEMFQFGLGFQNLSGKQWFELGYSYFLKYEFKNAIDAFYRCADTGERDLNALFFISNIHCKTGDFDESINVLKKMREKFPQEEGEINSQISAVELLKKFS